MNMRKSRFIVNLIVMVVAFALILSGCSTKPDAAEPADTGSPSDTSQPAEEPTPADPFEKYSTPVDVNTVMSLNSTIKYREGESFDNNVWTKAYEDVLGIKLNYMWAVDATQYDTKLNLSIASNDLPDIFNVNGEQLSTLVENDSVEALDDAYNTYGSDFTKELYDQDPVVAGLGVRDGKLYALTNGLATADEPPILYVREDWRQKLNLPEPETMDDFMQIAEAFVNQDPDGNGEDDTVGLIMTKTLNHNDAYVGQQGFADMGGFANAYHAYPGMWTTDDTGRIVYGSIQPEMKVVLQELQDMYNNGLLDKEFAVKDSAKAAELTSAGKCGLVFGAMWNPFFPLQTTIQNNEDAEWQPYPIPASDDQLVKAGVLVSATWYTVVRKGFEHPEAAVKMVNLFAEKGWGETADPSMMNGDGSEYVPFKYALAQVWPALKNVNQHNAIVEALRSGDTSKLDPESLSVYDAIDDYLTTGNVLNWGSNKIFGENATFDVINEYLANGAFMYDEYHSVPTPTMIDKDSTLQAMENEVFTKIIMGDSIDNFDKFVSDWKSLGGDDITAEMNGEK